MVRYIDPDLIHDLHDTGLHPAIWRIAPGNQADALRLFPHSLAAR